MFLQFHHVLNSVRVSFQRSWPESWAESWLFGYWSCEAAREAAHETVPNGPVYTTTYIICWGECVPCPPPRSPYPDGERARSLSIHAWRVTILAAQLGVGWRVELNGMATLTHRSQQTETQPKARPCLVGWNLTFSTFPTPVAHCSTFRLFVINIDQSWTN
jgi:hypothetical protein